MNLIQISRLSLLTAGMLIFTGLFASAAQDSTHSFEPITVENVVHIVQTTQMKLEHTASINHLAFNPDISQLAVATSDGIFVFDTVNYAEQIVFKELRPNSTFVAYSHDGSQLFGNMDGLRKWDLDDSTSELIWADDGNLNVAYAYAADEDIFAVSQNDVLTIFSPALLFTTGQRDLILEADVRAVAISPDATTVATINFEGQLKLWDTDRTPTDPPRFDLPIHLSGMQTNRDLVFSPDGRFLAVARTKDLNVTNVDDLEYSIEFWDVSTGQSVSEITLPKPPADILPYVSSMAFSPDGGLLAAGAADNTVLIWEVSTGNLLTSLNGHDDVVKMLAFSPDRTLLISGSLDGTVRLWGVK